MRSILSVLLFFAAGVALGAERLPNIVFIMADDFGYEYIGANGSTSYQTPRIDALAAGGMRFTHCHAMPLCTPSRVQLMTGRYNFRNYVRFGELDFRERTFAHFLKVAGYATAIAGKWQLSGGLEGPHRAGFDEYCLWQIFAADKGSRYANPKIHQNGKLLTGLEKRYGPDVFAEFVQDFVSRNRDKPFFVYWPMALTHSPFQPTPDSKPTAKQNHPSNFSDMVAYTDKLVGKLADHLEKLKLRENTLIVFTGDNGTGRKIRSKLGERTIVGGKGLTTTAGTRVPLIVNRPGVVPAGKVCGDLIDFTDMLPTLLAAAGKLPPTKHQLDGRSFLPQLRGETGKPREWIFCHYEPRHGMNNKKVRFAQDRLWKLYQDGRLYNLVADELETKPIPPESMDAKAHEARGKLQAVLHHYEREKSFGNSE